MVLCYRACGRFKWTCMVCRCWERHTLPIKILVTGERYAHAVLQLADKTNRMLMATRRCYDALHSCGIPEIRWPTRSSLWFIIGDEIALMTEIRAQNRRRESSSLMAGRIIITCFTCDSQPNVEISCWRVPCHILTSIGEWLQCLKKNNFWLIIMSGFLKHACHQKTLYLKHFNAL